MILNLEIKNIENIGNLSEQQKTGIQEIITALISSGGLTGVRGGQTIIHFDGSGVFAGIELDYWPWRRRKIN